MPGPLLIPGIIAGASLLGQGINAATQATQNRKTRQWQEKMYGIQRADSLADWAMQNQYNHPSSMMARLREAGLNPNLVYGNGQAVETASTPRAAQSGSWSPIAPKIDLTGAVQGGLTAYLDTQIKQAQTDNLRTQNTVLVQEALLKAAQIGQTEATTDRSRFDLAYLQEIKSMSVDALRAHIEKIDTEIKVSLDENERRVAMNAVSVEKAVEEILSIRLGRAKTASEIDHIKQQIENLKQDYRLKTFDEILRGKGIHPGTPAFFRAIQMALEGVGLKNPFSKDLPGQEGNLIPMPWPRRKK